MLGKNWVKASIIDPTKNSDQYNTEKCRAEVQCLDKWVYDEVEMWYGLRYLLSTNWKITQGTGSWANGCKIFQLHEGPNNAWAGGLSFWVPNQYPTVDYNGWNFETKRYEYAVYQRYLPLLLGEPFTVYFHVRAAENGVHEVYVNDNLVSKRYGDYRMSPDAKPRVSRYFKAGIYCGINQNPKTLYATDFIAATTKEDLDKWFKGGEVRLVAIKNVSDIDITQIIGRIIVDERGVLVPAGESVEVTLEEGEFFIVGK